MPHLAPSVAIDCVVQNVFTDNVTMLSIYGSFIYNPVRSAAAVNVQ